MVDHDVRRVLAERAARGETITYAELAAATGHEPANLGPLLREISVAEDDAGRGLLSAVVVRSQGDPLPSAGFFVLAAERGRDTGDRRRCWQEERDRVFAVHRRRT